MTYAPLLEHQHDRQGIADDMNIPNPGLTVPNSGTHEAQIAPARLTDEARPMLLPSDPAERKNLPITTGVLDYFPLAIAEVAKVSKAGSEQHHPGKPLHWDKSKSMDHADCIARHLIDRFSRDSDGMRHAAKLAWRALAFLETLLEDEARPACACGSPDCSTPPGKERDCHWGNECQAWCDARTNR